MATGASREDCGTEWLQRIEPVEKFSVVPPDSSWVGVFCFVDELADLQGRFFGTQGEFRIAVRRLQSGVNEPAANHFLRPGTPAGGLPPYDETCEE